MGMIEKGEWQTVYLWFPVYFDGKWHWLEQVERRTTREIDFTYHEYRSKS